MKNVKCAAELSKSSNIQTLEVGNEENLAIFTIILMATFGTKNVYSALVIIILKILYTMYVHVFLNEDYGYGWRYIFILLRFFLEN